MKKLFYAVTIILVLAGCAGFDTGSNGIPGAGIKAALSAEPENTADTPITIAVRDNNLSQDTMATINAAVMDAGRYIVLDLSGSTKRDNIIGDSEMQQIRDNQYIKGIILPSKLKEIGWWTFEGCQYLTSVTLPDSLVTIMDNAFRDCSGLTSLIFPDSLATIEYDVFVGCSGLTSVTFGKSLATIRGSAFNNCRSLTSITFPDSPDSLVSIEDDVFVNVPWLNDFLAAQPNGVVYLGKIAFRYKGAIPANTNITLKEDTVSIAGDAFYNHKELFSITLPDSVVSIEPWAFARSGLTSITFGKSLKTIKEAAFTDCQNLKELTIPASVTDLHFNALDGNPGLTFAIAPDHPSYSIEDGAGDIARDNPGFLPPNFSLAEMKEHIRIFEQVRQLTIVLEQFQHLATDYLMLASDNAYRDALRIYGSLREQSRSKVAGATALFDELLQYFTLHHKGRPGAEPTEKELEREFHSLIHGHIAGIKAALSAEPENTADTPITIAVRDNNLSQDTMAAINAAVMDAERYNEYIKGIILPSRLTSVDWWAFQVCEYLTSVTFPASLTAIRDGVFSNCSGLTSITLPDSLVSIGTDVFFVTPWINDFLAAQPNGMVYIGKIAFYHKGAVPANTNITLKEDTVCISGDAFYNRKGAFSITIPDSVARIEEWAFGRSGLTSVSFGKSVSFIGDSAFKDCQNLKELSIPASVTDLNFDAFDENPGLTLAVDAGNPAYSAQDGVVYNKDKTTLIRYPASKTGSSFVVPNGVTSIGERAFADCINLSSVTLPDSLFFIGWLALQGTALTSVTLPAKLEEIRVGAFRDTPLSSITIPASVRTIDHGAFEACPSLTSVTFAPGSRITNFGQVLLPWDGEFNPNGINPLREAYRAQGAGTYIGSDPDEKGYCRVWTKQ